MNLERPSLPLSHRHLSLPILHQALEPYRGVLERIAKPGWLLYARDVDSVSRGQTQFMGSKAYLPAGEGWPICSTCAKLLTFIWQVNFAEFANSEMFEEQGVFQFFYCWECFPLDEEQTIPSFAPENAYPRCIPLDRIERLEGLSTRWYPSFDPSMPSAMPLHIEEYAPAQGVSPIPFLSVPDAMDNDNPLYDVEMLSEDGLTDYNTDLETHRSAMVTEDYISQLGGYPLWIQDDNTPICPTCRQRSTFVGAIGSSDTHLFWGDSGYWYIFACKQTEECEGLRLPLMLSQSH